MFIIYAFGIGLSLIILGKIIELFIPKEVRALDKTPKGFPKNGVWNIENLDQYLCLMDVNEGLIIELNVFRQSGNHMRTEYYEDRQSALIAVNKLFSRLQESSIRIWKNTPRTCDLRRPYGSSNGTREGRKVWGCTLELLNTE